nr:DUF488 family protein [uncultured Clostridium sp.]
MIIKRIYDNWIDLDGRLYFVDLLWPRGLKKESIESVIWKKSIAPSTDLRKRFHAGEVLYSRFRMEYREELENNSDAADFLNECEEFIQKETIVLLFASKNQIENNAAVLKEWLEEKMNF